MEFVRAMSGRAELPAPPPGAPGPFSLADPDRARDLLERSGFTQVELTELVEPMRFGTDPDDTVEFVGGLLGWMLDGLDEAARHQALERLRSTATAHLGPEGVEFGSAAWLITALRAG